MNSFKSHNQNLIGVGLRSEHYPILENQKPKEIDWFEAISENYMNTQGRPLKMLLNLRENYPIALHGVGMSVASHEGVSQIYLKKLKDLVQTIQPLIVSDHLCWSQKAGHYSHDLLPFPLTEESLNLIVQNIQQVQDQLERPICLENISYYLTSKEDQMSEVSFINEVCSRSG